MNTFPQLLQNQKVWLITGAAGFVGSHLVESLLKADQKVIGLDNFLTGKQAYINDILSGLPPEKIKNFTFIEGDIRNFQTCLDITQGIDYVLHQAALGSIPRSLADPLATTEVNVTGFLNILRASEQNKVSRFIYASSGSVYGDSQKLPKVEDHIGEPLSPYAASKRVGELYAQVFHRCYNLPTIGLRYFNVFGPRQDFESMYAAVIPLWMKSLLRGEPCYINGDGLNSRDFCFIDNVIQANILAALSENTQTHGEIFNIAFGQQTSLLDLYNLIKDSLQLTTETSPIHRDARLGDIKHSCANIDKAKQLLGYNPLYSLQDGLKIMAKWASRAYTP